MFTDPQTLTGDAASSHAYALRSILDGKSLRAVATAPVNAPETLTLSHQVSSRGGIPLDRHLVRLDLTKINALGVPVVISFYVTIEVPQDAIVTAAMVKDMRTQMTGFLVDANLTKILNGEP